MNQQQPQQPQPGQPSQPQQQQPGQPMAPQPGAPMMVGGQQTQGQQRFPQGQMNPMMQQMQMMQQQMHGGMGGQGQFNNRGGMGQQYRQKQQYGAFPQAQGVGAQGMLGQIPFQQMGGMMNMPGGFNMQNGSQQRPRGEYPPNHSLYVGNLSDKTYDLDLFKYFQSHGYKLASAKVMVDRDTDKMRGFGYLNFHTLDEAERCLTEMNNAVIDNKQIVLSKKKDGDFDRQANVVVRNLAKEITQKDLQTLFQGFGHIKSCKLEVFNTGESRGFGYVQFDTQDNAQKAIKALDGTDHHGKKITVQIHAKKDEREGQGDNKYTNLFVSNLPLDVSSDKLKETFKQYGQILSAEINAKSNGTGFVSFNSHEDARNALESTNRKLKMGDQTILVTQHIYRKENELQPKGGQSKPIVQTMKEQFRSNVFVKFIPIDISREKILEEFGKAGSIDSVKLKNHEQKINGETFSNYQIGYVLFNDIEGAQKCIRMFDQSSVFGMRPLKVDFWQSKDDLKKERTERDVNDVNQMINFCRNANRMNNQMFGMQQMYQTSGYQNQMMGDGQRQQNYNQMGNRFNNRGRGGNRGGHRGGQQNRGYNNRNNQHMPQQQRNQGQYGNNRQMMNQQQQQQPGMPQPPVAGGQPDQANPGAQATPQPMMQQAQPQQQLLQLPDVDASQLDALKGEDRSNFVGNNIYGVIQGVFGDQHAPRLTGMLLDESAVNYKELLTNSQYFTNKVHEAHQLLVQSVMAENQQQQQ